MPYTSPAAIVTGTVISKTAFGDVVKADLDFLANKPACRVRNSGAIATVNVTDKLLTFDTERYDTDNMHSTSVNPGRITINTAGIYYFTAHIRWQSNATGYRQVRMLHNGTTEIAFHLTAPVATNVLILSFGCEWKCAVADYVEVWAFQNSGGGLNVDNAPAYSPEFSAHWVALG